MRPANAAREASGVREHLAPVLYFVQVHLLYATLVALVAWALTSLRRASVTAKFWVWTAASLNFALPLGGFIDRFGAADFPGAHQLGPLASFDLRLAHHPLLAALLCTLWLSGAVVMLLRLAVRILRERRERGPDALGAPDYRVHGVPVHITAGSRGPAVHGLLRTRICLPAGLEGLLSQRELDAVLLHEVTHAKRRDNLLGLIHEVAQCVLWFHPLLWLTSARVALYRELSCDESVLRASHGRLLVSALAKLAEPESSLVLRSAATSLVSRRLDRLLAPAMPAANRLLNGLLLAGFSVLLLSAVLLTIAHTACCLVAVA
jgi:beta-lactamase regulating signal transducer with metallopeptidase domain